MIAGGLCRWTAAKVGNGGLLLPCSIFGDGVNLKLPQTFVLGALLLRLSTLYFTNVEWTQDQQPIQTFNSGKHNIGRLCAAAGLKVHNCFIHGLSLRFMDSDCKSG